MRKRCLNKIFAFLFRLFVHMRHLNIDFSCFFLNGFGSFFLNGFPNPSIVRSMSSFCFVIENSLNWVRTCPLALLCFLFSRLTLVFRFTSVHTATLKKTIFLNDFSLGTGYYSREAVC